MDKLFLDTSYVIALSVPKDQNHKKAIQIADFLKIDKAKLITTLETGRSFMI
jgi:predicted nucleic acid-binding protein